MELEDVFLSDVKLWLMMIMILFLYMKDCYFKEKEEYAIITASVEVIEWPVKIVMNHILNNTEVKINYKIFPYCHCHCYTWSHPRQEEPAHAPGSGQIYQ